MQTPRHFKFALYLANDAILTGDALRDKSLPSFSLVSDCCFHTSTGPPFWWPTKVSLGIPYSLCELFVTISDTSMVFGVVEHPTNIGVFPFTHLLDKLDSPPLFDTYIRVFHRGQGGLYFFTEIIICAIRIYYLSFRRNYRRRCR